MRTMRATSFKFHPSFEPLDPRDVPAVTATAFASVAHGIPDSILIRGTNGADSVRIDDDGLRIAINNGALTSPIDSPVIIRVSLLDGNDSLTYLVRSPTTLVRKIEYSGGLGKNSFKLDDQDGVSGVQLNSGSFLAIDYDGAQGRVSSFDVHFNSILGSVVTLDAAFGAGNDRNVQVTFGNPSVVGNPSIDQDSTVTMMVDLGSGSTTGTAANPANDFTLTLAGNIGNFDTVASTVSCTVLGGAKVDRVDFVSAFNLGNPTAGSRVNFSANLGGGGDKFTLTRSAPQGLFGGAFLVEVHGGTGNDVLSAINGGNELHLDPGAVFDLNLFGEAGNDTVSCLFNTNRLGDDLDFGPGGASVFRLRLNGNAGNDTVWAALSNTSFSNTAAVYDVQVLGSGGNDVMGLIVTDQTDPPHLIYRGGAALLDGGLGVNTLKDLVEGNVRQINV